MKKKEILTFFFYPLVFFFISIGFVSCAATNDTRQLEEKHERDTRISDLESGQGNLVISNLNDKTTYEKALRILGRDLAFIWGRTVSLAFSEIENETPDKSVLERVKGILEGAAQHLVETPRAAEKLNLAFTYGRREIIDYFTYTISGKITEFDKIISRNRVDSGDAEVGGGSSRTNIAVDLNEYGLAKSLTLTLQATHYIPKRYGNTSKMVIKPVHLGKVTNNVKLLEHDTGGTFRFFIGGTGFSFGINYTINPSVHHVLRLLTEYSLIQLLGRIYLLPYWHCFNENNRWDEDLINFIKEDWYYLKYIPDYNNQMYIQYSEYSYRNSKVGMFTDLARLYYAYYIKDYVLNGELDKTIFITYKKKQKTSYVFLEENNVRRFIYKLLVYFKKNGIDKKATYKANNLNIDLNNVFSFENYIILFNESPFCSYPYYSNLKTFLYNELKKSKFSQSNLNKKNNTISKNIKVKGDLNKFENILDGAIKE